MVQYLMKKSLILIVLLFNVLLVAKAKIMLVPYQSSSTYNNTPSGDTNASEPLSKDHKTTGLYYLFKDTTYSIELAVEKKSLNYSNENISQTNFVSSYKTYLYKNVKLNTLFNYASKSRSQSNTIKVPLIGLTYITHSNLNIGLETAYSIYDSKALSSNVLQLKPSIGFAYGHKDSAWGMLFPKVSLYYIMPMSSTSSLEKNYISTEFQLIHRNGLFISKVSYWAGKQFYAIRDNGFTIYDLNEIHTSGSSISTRYKYNKMLGLKASYSTEYYKTFGTTKEEYMNKVSFVADFTF